jgi:hypothetical protein
MRNKATVMNDELEMMKKKAVMSVIRYYLRMCMDGVRENKRIKKCKTSLPVKILTWNCPSKSNTGKAN